jgi:glycine/D-amino acid oxidase-like deaminating enzyme
MPSTRYGTSLWAGRLASSKRPASSRQPFPRLKGDVETEVVVIGGGLTGCLVACQFARAGVATVLVEAEQAAASAALDAGWLAESPGVSFRELQQMQGLRAARRAFEASRKAALEAAAFLRRLNVRCELQPRESLLMAADADQARDLEREHQARVAAGIEAAWLTGRRVAADARVEQVRAAIKTHSEAAVDPLLAARGILKAAVDAGATVFEKSPVRRVRARSKAIDVTTASGVVHAQTAVIATGAPKPVVPALQRHVRVAHTYLVATMALPRALQGKLAAETILRDLAAPPHTVGVVDGGRLLIQGGDQPPVAVRLQDKTLIQRTGQLMYELSLMQPAISGVLPEYAWTAPRVTGRDGLMIVGAHRNFPRCLFALGLGSTGLAGAWLASRLLLRRHTGDPDAAEEVFGFSRFLG